MQTFIPFVLFIFSWHLQDGHKQSASECQEARNTTVYDTNFLSFQIIIVMVLEPAKKIQIGLYYFGPGKYSICISSIYTLFMIFLPKFAKLPSSQLQFVLSMITIYNRRCRQVYSLVLINLLTLKNCFMQLLLRLY